VVGAISEIPWKFGAKIYLALHQYKIERLHLEAVILIEEINVIKAI